MVQIDVPVAFAIGCLFADAARKQLQTGKPEYYYRTSLINNVYQIFFFAWIPVYFLLNYFGWETTHMWWHKDSVTAYPYYIPIFMIVFFVAVNIGFVWGACLVKAGRLKFNRIVYIGILIYSFLWIVVQPDRTLRLGTYSEWKAGKAPMFYEDSTFFAMVTFTLLLWGISLAIFYFRIRSTDKRLGT